MHHHVTPIAITHHALRRYRRRSGKVSMSKLTLANLVRRRILPQLALGMVPDSGGAVHVKLHDDLVAVALPNFTGGWVVKTVYGGPFWEAVQMSLRRFERLLELVEDYLDEHPEVAQDIAASKDIAEQVKMCEEVLRLMRPVVVTRTETRTMRGEVKVR